MISLILGLAVLGVLLWVIETKLPMDDTIKLTIRVLVVIGVVYYLVRLFGIVDLPLPHMN